MGRVEGKVGLITGAATGQGRSHAVRLAEEGADIIALDVADQIATVPYAMPTADDLAETVAQAEALGRRIVATVADVRDLDAVRTAVDRGVAELGRLDIVSANAGIMSFGRAEELAADQWRDVIDVNLTGVWHTARAAIPHMRAGGRGGSLVLTSSGAGLKPIENLAHYVAAKHGVVGLMRALALELAPDMIRVNSLHPTSVNTGMIQNPVTYGMFAPDLPEEERTVEVLRPRFQTLNALPIPLIEPVDVSHALLWLASDEARFVTGVALPVDAGVQLL